MKRPLILSLALVASCGDETSPHLQCPQSGTPVMVQLATKIDSQFLGTRPENATWVAFQDSDCPWQPITGNGGQYQFRVQSGRYGVAIACATTDLVQLNVRYSTVAERTVFEEQCIRKLPDSTTTHEIGASMTNTAPNAVRLSIHTDETQKYRIGPGALFQTSWKVLAENHDLVAAAFDTSDALQKLFFYSKFT